MNIYLINLQKYVKIGGISGSDLIKQKKQLGKNIKKIVNQVF